jgi:serine-type D-Ala-D-Ala carboxypeptidase (penicillin-binding protein 5/6)
MLGKVNRLDLNNIEGVLMIKKFFVLFIAISLIVLYLNNMTYADEIEEPSIVSEGAILIDSKTGRVLYEKNADASMYPASLTKIATAIYTIENANLEDLVTVSENALDVEGTRVYLEKGEQVTLKKLVQGLLINSGNDAGVAIAEHVSGSVEEFSSDLNAYLQNVIGVKNTHFENPHGLFDANHFTTPEDLAKITQYALKNPTFKEIFGTVELDWDGETWDTTIISHHKMLKGEIPYEEVTGGKTGFVNESGFTLATSAEGENIDLIVITMKGFSQNVAYEDTAKLLDYGFANYETVTLQGGSIIELNNQGYKVPKEYNVTKPIDSDIQQQINPYGELEIIDNSGNVLNTVPLVKINEEKSIVVQHKVDSNNHTIMWIMFGSLGILILLIIYLVALRIKKKRERNIFRSMY